MRSQSRRTRGLWASAAAPLLLLVLTGAAKHEGQALLAQTKGPVVVELTRRARSESGAAPASLAWQGRTATGQTRVRVEGDAGERGAPTQTVTGSAMAHGTRARGEPASAHLPVLAQAATEALLRSVWTDMKAALMATDIERALEFFAPAQRPRYQTLFTALRDRLPQIARDMGDIQLVSIEELRAKCRLRRPEPYGAAQVPLTHYVYFVQDATGRWYIEEF